MKAFIYNSPLAAETDNDACQALFSNLTFTGNPEFTPENLNIRYSTIIAHPVNQQWALIADHKMEVLLNKQATELDETWQPNPVL